MNKARSLKLWAKALVITLSLALMLTCLGFTSAFSVKGYESNSFEDFSPTEIGLENNQFDNHSGSIPESPSGWTAQAYGEMNNQGSAVGGVLPLGGQIYKKDMESAKLDIYPEFEGKFPTTPFGTSAFPLTNKKLLLVNTAQSETVYGYKSNTLTLNPNKFYKFSAYVKTGDFKDGRGASIRLSGLGEDVAFANINTKNILTSEELDGFKEFSFYIATSPYKTSSVEINLCVGNFYSDEKKPETDVNSPASGYAFFDNITANEISPYRYYVEAANSTSTLVKDFSRPMDGGNWSFDTSLTDWSFAGSESDAGNHGVYMGGYTENNPYNLKKDPLSPNGKDDASGILVLSSYKNSQLTDVSLGYKSIPFNIERFKYYRVSSFVKTVDVSGSSGANMVLTSDMNTPDDEKDDHKTSLPSLTGDDANTARYGWKEQVLYVKGSIFADYKASIQLRLGTEEAPGSGIAMFDNVKIMELTSAEFTEYSASGTVASMDGTYPTGTVANGNFFNFGQYDELKFPIAPADWKLINASNTEANGASTGKVNTDSLISGIIPTDREHFDANILNYGTGVSSSLLPEHGNVLYMTSKDATAAGYRSAAISVAATKAGKITVKLKADNITGYGVNLVLKDGNNVISTIEGIKNTGSFKEYTFAVDAGTKDRSALSVEIWLGMFDRTTNATKLSAGNLYVEDVSYKEFADTDTKKFSDFKKEYEDKKSINLNPTDAAYSFNNNDLAAYDYYDTKFVKHAYSWSLSANGNAPLGNVSYGIFDSDNMQAGQGEVPSYFRNNQEGAGKYVLMLHNAKATSSKLTLNNMYTLSPSLYYQVTVSMKLDLNVGENSKGVNLYLNGTDYKFENVLSTSVAQATPAEKEEFKNFTFFVAMGTESKDVSIALSLGGDKFTREYCEGRVYINNVSFTEIQKALYDVETKKIDDDSKYAVKVDLTAPVKEDTDDGKKGSIDWWVIPSILFGVAILIALVGYAVRRIMAKNAAKPKKGEFEKISSYDRNATINKMEKDAEGNLIQAPSDDTSYNEFDDDKATENKVAKEKPKAKVETETAITEDTSENAVSENETADESSMTENQGAESTVKVVKTEKAPVKEAENKALVRPIDAYTDEFDD